MSTALTSTTHTGTTPLDPITLIQCSSKAESTKTQYTRALKPYLDAGRNLTNVVDLAEYAATLGQSRRAHLRSAVSLWARATKARIKATVTPETVDRAQAAIMRLDSIGDVIEVPTPKGTKAHTWLSQSQVKALMNTCGEDIVGLRDRVVLGLLVGAGLRRQELADLTWGSVKTQPVGDKMRTVLDVHGKGAKDRVVPISERLVAILNEWAEITGRDGHIARSLGMARRVGESLSGVAIFRVARKRGALIGVPGLAAHDLRRTFAQLGYEAGVPITQISRLLGHSSVQTTERYLNLDLDLEVTVSDFVPL